MSEDLRIDSHKLIFHPKRVSEWLEGVNIYPLTVELSPSGSCNHRCRFCAFDYLGFKPAFLKTDMLIKNIEIMASKGVKAVVLAGVGEPLLHKDIADIIGYIKKIGMDVAMSSNGTLFDEKMAESCLPALTWIRFSVNAGTEETHQIIHGGKRGDFSLVLNNLRTAVDVKKRKRLSSTIGVQLLLIKENVGEVLEFGKILKEIGVDYYTVKPYSHHPKSFNEAGEEIDYLEHLNFADDLMKLQDEKFKVYYRETSMKKLSQSRNFDKCRGLPFLPFIDAQGNVWACSAYLGDERFCYGNLYEDDFRTIWEGKRRREINSLVEGMDIAECRELCRLDEVNKYLHQLKNPGNHVNFI